MAVYGGMPLGRQAKQAKDADILVATPGRLKDLVDRRLVSLGEDRHARPRRGRPDARHGLQAPGRCDRRDGSRARVRRCSSRRRSTARWAISRVQYTRDPCRFEVAPPAARRWVARRRPRVRRCDGRRQARRACRAISRPPTGSRSCSCGRSAALTGSRGGCSQRDVPAAAMHGDMPQNRRERTLERFRSGHVPTLVATELAARGLDLVEITNVINFDPPADNTSYLHRVGAHRSRRPGWRRRHVRPSGAAGRRQPRRSDARGGETSSSEPGLRSAPAKLVYTSRRGRRSRW